MFIFKILRPRFLLGGGALGLYGWRIQDPPGSYTAFYELSNWASGMIFAENGIQFYIKNILNVILVQQVDGFLLGVALTTLLTIILWPFRAILSLGWRGIVRLIKGKEKVADEGDPLMLDLVHGRAERTPVNDDHIRQL